MGFDFDAFRLASGRRRLAALSAMGGARAGTWADFEAALGRIAAAVSSRVAYTSVAFLPANKGRVLKFGFTAGAGRVLPFHELSPRAQRDFRRAFLEAADAIFARHPEREALVEEILEAKGV